MKNAESPIIAFCQTIKRRYFYFQASVHIIATIYVVLFGPNMVPPLAHSAIGFSSSPHPLRLVLVHSNDDVSTGPQAVGPTHPLRCVTRIRHLAPS